jgi:hypothetical protein
MSRADFGWVFKSAQRFSPERFSRSLILALTLRSIGSPNWMINQDLCGGCRAVSEQVPFLRRALAKYFDFPD